jgi:DNA-binding response OmpR family regulator
VAKQNLLLVDADPRSLRLLEVSLRKAGFSVTTCGDVDSALELVDLVEPNMIIADTRLPGKDGFVLVEALRARPSAAHIPLMFLSSDPSVEGKVRGLQLGIEDYLTKPATIREILARVKYVMERSERNGMGRTAKTRFSGSLEEMGLVDLLQTIDMSRKSGVLRLSSGKRLGSIFFHEGRAMEAELGPLRGEQAIYRFLLWNEGSFEIEFRDVKADDKLGVPTQALLMEGMRRLDEWGRLQEQLPGLDCVLEIQHVELAARLSEIPDELNGVLRAFDGQRDLSEVLDVAGGDDLTNLNAIGKLFFDGFLMVRHRTDPTADTQIGVQSGLPSDPFLGYVPQESAPPERPIEVVGKPGSVRGGANVSAQLTEPACEEKPRPSGGLMRGGNSDSGGVGAGRTSLAVVQLRRVLAISESNGQRPRAVSMEIGPVTAPGEGQGPESRSSTPAPEGDDDMMKSKRKAEAAEQPNNVIPLHGARAEAPPSEARASDRAPKDTRVDGPKDDPSGSMERPIGKDDDDGLPADLSMPPPAPAAVAAGLKASDKGEPHEQHDEDAETFFSSAPPKAIAPNGEPWTDFDHEPIHPPTHRGAMYWTAGIAGAGLLLIGAFLLYHKVLMPTPEELGAPAPIALPTPDMVKVVPSEPAPEPAAPSAEAPAEAPTSVEAPASAEAPAPPAELPSAEVPAAEVAPNAEAAPSPPVAAPNAQTTQLIAEARKLGFRPRAEELLLQASKLAPSSSEPLSALALLYLNQGKNAQAKQRAEQALALDDKNDEAWIVLGAAEGAVGRAKAARTAYMRCAALPSGKHVAECRRLVR